MAVQPLDFFQFAEKVVRDPQRTEFDLRNAASRAYYAAFHCCQSKEHLCPRVNRPDLGPHDRMYERFAALPSDTSDDEAMKKMAYLASMMKAVRKAADYDVRNDFDPQDATQQVSDARRVVNIWRGLPV